MINNEITSWTQINMETLTKGEKSRVYKSLIMIRLSENSLLFLSAARMCGLYLIVIQICLYLYTEYGTSY